jgi:hypothetical protein
LVITNRMVKCLSYRKQHTCLVFFSKKRHAIFFGFLQTFLYAFDVIYKRKNCADNWHYYAISIKFNTHSTNERRQSCFSHPALRTASRKSQKI